MFTPSNVNGFRIVERDKCKRRVGETTIQQ